MATRLNFQSDTFGQLVRFAIAQQGAAPADLHAAFGTFLDQVKPADLDQPTQPAGVLHA